MSLSLFVPNRTVLQISDDALYIYSTSAKGVKPVEIVPWGAKDFIDNVASIISKECGRKPILMLNDMVEQHYRKERVVRSGVNALDRSTMLKRRLAVAFNNYSVRAALPLKEKAPKTENQPAADIYIFAAVPDTEQLNLTTKSVQKSLASVAGLCLLPVESADMVKTLSQKLGKKTKSKAAWSVFIGQHQSGSLRQVVTKNGELALTRMSPLAVDQENSAAWAQEIHKEFKATMSYLARFGYDPRDGLDVIIISDPSAAESIEALVEEQCNLYVMSAPEAAKTLGVNLGLQASMYHADALHVAWAGRKSKFSLPMKAQQVDKVHKPRQVAMAATIVLLLSGSFLGYQLMEQYGNLSVVHDSIDSVKKRKAQLDLNYQREVERKEAMGFDVRLVQNSIAVYDDLESDNIEALDLFKGMGRAMGKDLRVDSIELMRYKPPPVERFIQQQNKGHPVYQAVMKMTYPGTTNVDQGNQEVRDLRGRLEQSLKGHTVEVQKFLKDYEYTEGLVVETGDLETENLQQDFVAEILITGPVPSDGGQAQ